MSFALISSSVPPENRAEIGGELARMFDKPGTTDASRANILGALAHAMVEDKGQQADWASLLRSCLRGDVDEDHQRVALVKAITMPPAEPVIATLTAPFA